MGRKRNVIVMVVTRVVSVVLPIMLALVVFSVLVSTKTQPEKTDLTGVTRTVLAIPLEPIVVGRTWDGFGTAEASKTADVPARVAAVVSELPEAVEVGRAVSQGTLLVQLDSGDFTRQVEISQQNIADIDAQLDRLRLETAGWQRRLELVTESVSLARADFDRVNAMIEDGAGNQVELDRARDALLVAIREEVSTREESDKIAPRRASLESLRLAANAALRQAQEDVTRCAIRSPIDGVLEFVDIEIGEHVMPGQRIARVVSLDEIEVQLRLPAAARPDIRIGDRVTLTASSGDIQWTAQVSRIAPRDDPGSRTMSVFVEHEQVATSSNLLAPGRFVRADVRSKDERMRWVVPRRSMDGERIWLVRDGALRSIAADVAFYVEMEIERFGLPDRDWAVVDGELDSGDQLVVNVSSSLIDGLPAQAVPPEGYGSRAASGGSGAMQEQTP